MSETLAEVVAEVLAAASTGEWMNAATVDPRSIIVGPHTQERLRQALARHLAGDVAPQVLTEIVADACGLAPDANPSAAGKFAARLQEQFSARGLVLVATITDPGRTTTP